MNDERISELLDIPGVVLGTELENMDTVGDIQQATPIVPVDDTTTQARLQIRFENRE